MVSPRVNKSSGGSQVFLIHRSTVSMSTVGERLVFSIQSCIKTSLYSLHSFPHFWREKLLASPAQPATSLLTMATVLPVFCRYTAGRQLTALPYPNRSSTISVTWWGPAFHCMTLNYHGYVVLLHFISIASILNITFA